MNDDRAVYKPQEARLIQLLRQRFERANWDVDDHLRVGDLPLEIDMLESEVKDFMALNLKEDSLLGGICISSDGSNTTPTPIIYPALLRP